MPGAYEPLGFTSSEGKSLEPTPLGGAEKFGAPTQNIELEVPTFAKGVERGSKFSRRGVIFHEITGRVGQESQTRAGSQRKVGEVEFTLEQLMAVCCGTRQGVAGCGS